MYLVGLRGQEWTEIQDWAFIYIPSLSVPADKSVMRMPGWEGLSEASMLMYALSVQAFS